MRADPPLPPPARAPFVGGIDHPALWLWDAWLAEGPGGLDLFTLALSRTDAGGQPIPPERRDDFPFHVRRFRSADGGATWRDEGVFLTPGGGVAGASAHNVWSGGALRRERLLFGFTGVRAPGPARRYLQSICLAEGAGEGTLRTEDASLLSDPERDYDAIRAAGYFLGPRETLGSDAAEAGGPILAWRDPFLIADGEGLLVFWSAKVAPAVPAIAWGRAVRGTEGWRLERLRAPITLPDADGFTQAEVPKLYRAGGGWRLLVSSCDRLSEDQPAEDVTKALRLYASDALEGPWRPAYAEGSVVPGAEGLFGGALTAVGADTATLIAPWSDLEPDPRRFRFAPPRTIPLG